jgi:hypothetical protein
MDWSALAPLFECELSGRTRLIVGVLGAVGSVGTFVVIIERILRGVRHRRAAAALRDEGEFRARLNHRDRAMELYDLSIKLNPKAAHVYYLRGMLREEMNNLTGAVRDWKMCVDRLSTHSGALGKLRDHEVPAPGRGSALRLAYVALTLLALLTALGAAMARG